LIHQSRWQTRSSSRNLLRPMG